MPETRKRIDVLVTVEARDADAYRSIVEREFKISGELVAQAPVQQAISVVVGEAIVDVLAEAIAKSAPAAIVTVSNAAALDTADDPDPLPVGAPATEDLGDHHVFPGASR